MKSRELKHYVGKILDGDGDSYKIIFIRKTASNNKYIFPQIADVAWIEKKRTFTKVVPLQET